MGRREHSLFFILLKPQIFIPSKFRGMKGNEIRFIDFFIKTPKIPLYIQSFILGIITDNPLVVWAKITLPTRGLKSVT